LTVGETEPAFQALYGVLMAALLTLALMTIPQLLIMPALTLLKINAPHFYAGYLWWDGHRTVFRMSMFWRVVAVAFTGIPVLIVSPLLAGRMFLELLNENVSPTIGAVEADEAFSWIPRALARMLRPWRGEQQPAGRSAGVTHEHYGRIHKDGKATGEVKVARAELPQEDWVELRRLYHNDPQMKWSRDALARASSRWTGGGSGSAAAVHAALKDGGYLEGRSKPTAALFDVLSREV